jgi:phage I-like protein
VRVDELNAAKAEVVALAAAKDEATAQVVALTAEVSTLKAAAQDVQLSALVDGYVRDRRITPAQRDQALALAKASMEAFSAFIESAPALIDDQPTRAPVTDGLQLTAEERAKAKALGISPEAYATALEQTRSALGI